MRNRIFEIQNITGPYTITIGPYTASLNGGEDGYGIEWAINGAAPHTICQHIPYSYKIELLNEFAANYGNVGVSCSGNASLVDIQLGSSAQGSVTYDVFGSEGQPDGWDIGWDYDAGSYAGFYLCGVYYIPINADSVNALRAAASSLSSGGVYYATSNGSGVFFFPRGSVPLSTDGTHGSGVSRNQPYIAPVNMKVTISTGSARGGTFTVTAGSTTAAIAYDASAADISGAINSANYGETVCTTTDVDRQIEFVYRYGGMHMAVGINDEGLDNPDVSPTVSATEVIIAVTAPVALYTINATTSPVVIATTVPNAATSDGSPIVTTTSPVIVTTVTPAATVHGSQAQTVTTTPVVISIVAPAPRHRRRMTISSCV